MGFQEVPTLRMRPRRAVQIQHWNTGSLHPHADEMAFEVGDEVGHSLRIPGEQQKRLRVSTADERLLRTIYDKDVLCQINEGGILTVRQRKRLFSNITCERP